MDRQRGKNERQGEGVREGCTRCIIGIPIIHNDACVHVYESYSQGAKHVNVTVDFKLLQ